jgi:hypothetical protein
MWFNGTAVSAKAQRALRNENITIVAHNTGCIHCLYENATIDKKAYKHFTDRLDKYLTAELDLLMIANFLRANRDYQKYFQFCHKFREQEKFINAEVLFHYEHGSKFRIADATFDKLIDEITEEDFSPYKMPDRVCCEHLRRFIEAEKIDIKTADGRKKLSDYLKATIPDADELLQALADFVHIEPKLPSGEKKYEEGVPIELSVEFTRKQIIDYLQQIRGSNVTADLAFYAWRDIKSCDWRPFIKAAVERNPVCLEMRSSHTVEQVYQWLQDMDNESIYEGPRLAQPDEVANYQRGDGLERAFVLVDFIHKMNPQENIKITVDNENVVVETEKQYHFVSGKGLKQKIEIEPDGRIVVQED